MPDTTNWFPVVTLLAGFFTKALFDWLDHRRTRERERSAREAARHEQLLERRMAFQRQTLLDLQEAVLRLQRSTGAMNVEDVMAHRDTGKWQKQLYTDGLSDAFMEQQRQTTMLAVRVRDDSVREMVEALKRGCSAMAFARTENDNELTMTEMMALGDRLNQRIGELLRQMDDEEDQRAWVTNKR